MNENTSTWVRRLPAGSPTRPLGDVIAINEGLIKDHLDKIVKTTVEEMLNAMLDAEADQLCGAQLATSIPQPGSTLGVGKYERQLHT